MSKKQAQTVVATVSTVSKAQSAKAAKAVGAAFATFAASERKLGATLLASVAKAATALPGLTDVTYGASSLSADITADMTARGLTPNPAQLSRIKVVMLVMSNRPADVAAGAWEGDPAAGENLSDYAERVRPFRDNLQTAKGMYVMKRDASGGKAATRGAKAGKLAANAGKGKAAAKAAAVAAKVAAPPVVKGPSHQDIAEARKAAALTLMGTPKLADDLLRVLNDKSARGDLLKAMGAIVASMAEASAAFEAEAKAAQRTNLAAPSLAQARAKASASKANGATVN